MLAIAITEVESNGETTAVRFEPKWKYLYNVEHFAKQCSITIETEQVLQSMSFGLMQVMGSVARELGFTGNLIQLSDPYIGSRYGCAKLGKLFSILKSTDDVIAAYNAGSPLRQKDGTYVNQGYVDRVRAALLPVSGPA